MLFMGPTLLSMVVLAGVHPLEDRPTNMMEVFNTCMVMMMIYCLLCFTPMALDAQARYTMGFVMVGLVGFNILANIVVVSKDPVRHSCMRCKMRWATRHRCQRRWGQRCTRLGLWCHKVCSCACCSSSRKEEDLAEEKD